MGQFIYFAERVTKAKPEDIGLGYAFDAKPTTSPVEGGPGGVPGLLIAAKAEAIRYLPDEQVWEQINESLHVGYEKSDKPTPADLERREQLGGKRLKMADGNEWMVPRLRLWAGEFGWVTALPSRMKRKGGEWVAGDVLPEHAESESLGTKLLDRMIEAHEQSGLPDATVGMSYADAADYVSRVLAINYRVGPDELSLLGALPMDHRLAGALRIATDYEEAEAWALGKQQAPVA